LKCYAGLHPRGSSSSTGQGLSNNKFQDLPEIEPRGAG
jgi:hypothetical protein